MSQSALRNKSALPELLPEITRQVQNPNWREGSDQPETMPRAERLEEHPEVQLAWDRYIKDKWLPWAEEHNAWEKVHKAYSTLFAIHQEQLRLGEEYELVLGLGLLTWQTHTGQRVRRHLIVADAILEFEARLGRLTGRPVPRVRKALDASSRPSPLPPSSAPSAPLFSSRSAYRPSNPPAWPQPPSPGSHPQSRRLAAQS